MIRIIIAGGRDFNNFDFLKESVDDVIYKLSRKNWTTGLGKYGVGEWHRVEFISGMARGADTLGEIYAMQRDAIIHKFPADWNSYGKSAGYIRNEQMAKHAMEGDCYGVLIAFWDNKSKGTKHMIDLATKYGLDVYVINY